jgi:hypothetical protein
MVTVLMAAFIPWHGNRTIRVLTLLMSLVSTETMFPTFAAFHHPDSDESVGFFLMHDVLNVETTISLITYVKTTPPGLTDFVDRLSKTAKETQATLNRLEKDDPSFTILFPIWNSRHASISPPRDNTNSSWKPRAGTLREPFSSPRSMPAITSSSLPR